MSRKGWWQQLQSGEYSKTKLKYADSNWVIGKPPSPKLSRPSPKNFPPHIVKPPIPKHSPITEFISLGNVKNQQKPSHSDIIKEPQITIDAIKIKLRIVYDIKELHDLLSCYLEKLRTIYKADKTVFSHNDIIFLKNIKCKKDALFSLIKINNNLNYTYNDENPSETYIKLLKLSDLFNQTAVRRKVLLIREQLLKKFSLHIGPFNKPI